MSKGVCFEHIYRNISGRKNKGGGTIDALESILFHFRAFSAIFHAESSSPVFVILIKNTGYI
jgi:hypothetical protein